jgi:hypothetical protein
MQKFKRLWAWDKTVKRLNDIKIPGESNAKILDMAINLLDRKSIIIESRRERESRLMSH